jgi:cephalosporin hydroxylase
MKINIDADVQSVDVGQFNERKAMPLYQKKSFESISDLISDQWVKTGWNEEHSCIFAWMGRPITQLPEDLIVSRGNLSNQT